MYLQDGSHESLGVTVHLATLYAFDLDKKTSAERLFLRCLRSLREIQGTLRTLFIFNPLISLCDTAKTVYIPLQSPFDTVPRY